MNDLKLFFSISRGTSLYLTNSVSVDYFALHTSGFKGGGERGHAPQDAFNCEKSSASMGDFVPQTPYRGSAPGPRWGTSVPRPPELAPSKFIFWIRPCICPWLGFKVIGLVFMITIRVVRVMG